MTAIEFIAELESKNVTKLIIDLSGNDGGAVIPAFHLFMTLFPEGSIYSGTRFRATEAVDIMGKIFSAANDHGNLSLDLPLLPADAVAVDQQHTSGYGFQTWNSLYGPYNVAANNLSALYSILPMSVYRKMNNIVKRRYTHQLNVESIVLVSTHVRLQAWHKVSSLHIGTNARKDDRWTLRFNLCTLSWTTERPRRTQCRFWRTASSWADAVGRWCQRRPALVIENNQ